MESLKTLVAYRGPDVNPFSAQGTPMDLAGVNIHSGNDAIYEFCTFHTFGSALPEFTFQSSTICMVVYIIYNVLLLIYLL